MSLSLYIDEDAMASAMVAGLRRAGVDVLTADEAGNRGIADEAHLAFAAAQKRLLYSFNRRDFARIHAEWLRRGAAHPGIILLTDRRASIGYQISEVVALLNREPEEAANTIACI